MRGFPCEERLVPPWQAGMKLAGNGSLSESHSGRKADWRNRAGGWVAAIGELAKSAHCQRKLVVVTLRSKPWSRKLCSFPSLVATGSNQCCARSVYDRFSVEAGVLERVATYVFVYFWDPSAPQSKKPTI